MAHLPLRAVDALIGGKRWPDEIQAIDPRTEPGHLATRRGRLAARALAWGRSGRFRVMLDLAGLEETRNWPDRRSGTYPRVTGGKVKDRNGYPTAKSGPGDGHRVDALQKGTRRLRIAAAHSLAIQIRGGKPAVCRIHYTVNVLADAEIRQGIRVRQTGRDPASSPSMRIRRTARTSWRVDVPVRRAAEGIRSQAAAALASAFTPEVAANEQVPVGEAVVRCVSVFECRVSVL